MLPNSAVLADAYYSALVAPCGAAKRERWASHTTLAPERLV